jgi:hypothetical protein
MDALIIKLWSESINLRQEGEDGQADQDPSTEQERDDLREQRPGQLIPKC